MSDAMPPWWPDGAREDLVRACNCEWCAALVEQLEDERAGVAVDGDHASLRAFADGGERR